MTTPDYYKISVVAKIGKDEYNYVELECKDLIDALIKESGFEGIDAFNYGNIIKYIFRMNRKTFAHADAVKAINYLNELLPISDKFIQITKRLDNES